MKVCSEMVRTYKAMPIVGVKKIAPSTVWIDVVPMDKKVVLAVLLVLLDIASTEPRVSNSSCI